MGDADAPAGGGRWCFALLAAILLGPFILREISPQLEPYPAVLFPVGASVIHLTDTVMTYRVMEVFAVMPDGSERKISPDDFLGGIPVQYFKPLCKAHFGLAPRRYASRWSNWLGRGRNWTDADRRKTMEWLAMRANKTGFPDAVAFRFRTSSRSVVIGTGKIVPGTVQDSYELPIEHE